MLHQCSVGRTGSCDTFIAGRELLPRIIGDRFKPVPIIKDYSAKWARQGQAWGDESPVDRMVEEMWAKYRKTLKAPADGWRVTK